MIGFSWEAIFNVHIDCTLYSITDTCHQKSTDTEKPGSVHCLLTPLTTLSPVLLTLTSNETNVVFFYVVFIPFPPDHNTSNVCHLSLSLLTNTVSPVQACLSIWWERVRGNQKENNRWPLNIQPSLLTRI